MEAQCDKWKVKFNVNKCKVKCMRENTNYTSPAMGSELIIVIQE